MIEIINQEYTSEKSSIKQLPAGFGLVKKHFGWKSNSMNLDIGGGKYDIMSIELQKLGVTNLIYDPYNRTAIHNERVLSIAENGVDTVTVFNVLNVIKELDIQIAVLTLGYHYLKDNGMIFIRSTYMNRSGVSGVTKIGTYQHYLNQSDYLNIVKNVFCNAKLKNGLIYAKK